ncbi:MAG: hypothetical protein RBR01_09900 [Desulfobacterales bacterium]|jgi:hypothetical protein|nr:hypothetical protein [Desulfobacterales bacterium]MDD3081296.1 hypothetical protein [Desulfobacterales bacterium]MDD3950711.1 hypothetical protein [Desulfobacterales bacterium]MDD4464333.1 hypothetical protein [Desulfobacterales bacterium]MDY0378734.1 hypothetical protein [Desulfobacterales bacterium]
MKKTIRLPDVCSGSERLFYADPIEYNPAFVKTASGDWIRDPKGEAKLQCAEPGEEYLCRWIMTEGLKNRLELNADVVNKLFGDKLEDE